MRKLTASILLAIGLTGTLAYAETTPVTQDATQTTQSNAVSQNTTNQTPATETSNQSAQSPAAPGQTATDTNTLTETTTIENTVAIENVAVEENKSIGFDKDLSVWGMYQNADIVVKTVMIGLILASIITWALLFSKGSELIITRRRLKKEQVALMHAKSLDEAVSIADGFNKNSVSRLLLNEAVMERTLSAASTDLSGTKDRTAFRLERAVAAISRYMGRGNGYLATIGAISPFVGLFGTVWGIMNSFIGIAHSQTTNLAVVAPGIAEALLATAIGLIAAIPAVVIYNIFARMINSYRGQVGDMAAQATLLLGRDLDLANCKAR